MPLIDNIWLALLVDTELARNNHWLISDHLQPTLSEVEQRLAASVLIRTMSFLDMALEEYIEQNSIDSRKNSRLAHRLQSLRNRLMNFDDLTNWKDRRNELSHELRAACDWNDVSNCQQAVFQALHHLGLLEKHPTLKIKKTIARIEPATQDDILIEQLIEIVVYEGDTIYWKSEARKRVGPKVV